MEWFFAKANQHTGPSMVSVVMGMPLEAGCKARDGERSMSRDVTKHLVSKAFTASK